MSAARAKLVPRKPGRPAFSALENQVAQALHDLESNSNELRADLKELKVVSVRDVVVPAKPQSRHALVIFVPYPQLKAFHKIQKRLVHELEKKFSGKHVVIVGQRRILKKPSKTDRNPLKQKRPRSRTLTAVHDALLDDLVYPTDITGKRTRYRLNGSVQYKVYLDKKEQSNTCLLYTSPSPRD
eukprot:TRINITY_DN3451_c0_g1_i2.p1 TRINITY_DN3451_c0_g1~~TRINITY_DN3451_c0_g1_i2.p1  ORF type:complete len:184 (+),score=46.71 TRINITY_DN3451_c0_g1_i2:67-618(+)